MAAAKKKSDVEGEGDVNERTAQRWFLTVCEWQFKFRR
jgi:hypothetical protein